MPITCVSDNTALSDFLLSSATVDTLYSIWITKHLTLFGKLTTILCVIYEVVIEDSNLLGCYAVSLGKHFPSCKGL